MMREFLKSEFTEFQVCKSFESALRVSEGVIFLFRAPITINAQVGNTRTKILVNIDERLKKPLHQKRTLTLYCN